MNFRLRIIGPLILFQAFIPSVLFAFPKWKQDPITLPNPSVGKAYAQELAPFTFDSDGDTDTPLIFTMLSGPSFLSLSPSGVLFGTPSGADVGPSSVIVGAHNQGANNGSEVTIKLTVTGIPAPCKLSAHPSQVILGDKVLIKLISFGDITSAAIDGRPVGIPTGTREYATSEEGTFVSRASISGPQGTFTCEATYEVREGGGI